MDFQVDTVNRYAYVYCTQNQASNGWKFQILDGGAVKGEWSFPSGIGGVGLKTIDMAAVYTGPVDEIRLSALGNGGETNKWDYIFAAAEEQLNLASDVIGRVTVELASGKGLNGCSFRLKNQDGEYNDLSLADVILVYVDSGAGNRKVFGGRIAEVRLLHSRYGRRYAEVKCVDHGIDLVAGDPLLKEYEDQTIKQMLQDILQNYAVTDYGVDPDNELTDTYDMFFDWTPTWQAIRKICNLQECEWYVDKSGNFWVYPRGKYTSSITIDTSKILSAKRTIDYYSLRNMLYGLGGEVFDPLDGDQWTEDSNELTKWSISGVSGQTLTVSQSTESAVGSYSVKGECVQPSDYPGPWDLIFTPASTLDLSAKWKHKPKRLEFWIKATDNVGGQIRVRLEDPSLNIAEKYVQADSEWRKHTLTLGPDGEWHMVYGSFDWTQVQKIIFNCYYAAAGETQAVWIDGLRFAGQKLRQYAWDGTSQSAYGKRNKLITAEEIVSPETMYDYLARILTVAKDGVQSLELTVKGDHYQPGHIQAVSLASIGANGNYRISQVNHTITRYHWWTKLSLEYYPTGKFSEFMAEIAKKALETS